MRVRRLLLVVRLAAAAMATARIARAARRQAPLAPASDVTELPTISVVVPARDEAGRIGPLLERICGAPGIGEVLVVDDQSSDATASIARDAGARVVVGAPLPDGWAGKAWALQQGLRAASGAWVVTLDADTRPSAQLPRSLVARAIDDRLDIVSVGGRFECPTAAVRWLHPAMLTTLVYRFAPPGFAGPVRADRLLANGQCMAAPRERWLQAGGFEPVAGALVEDVAIVRHLAGLGWRATMLDGAELLTTRMFDDAPSAFRGWARSLAMPGVEAWERQVRDLAVVLFAQALPVPRLLTRRGGWLDVGLALMRLGTLAGTRRAYERRGAAYWLSPAADLVAAAALLRGIVTPRQPWRGRTYAPVSRR